MKNTKESRFVTWQGIPLVILTLALCLAAGCAADESKPVVTSDDLTPFSATVSDTREGEAEGGNVTGEKVEKTYSYYWAAENIDEAAENIRKQDAFSDIQLAPGVSAEEQMNDMLNLYRSIWEEELALDPAVPPQEAANRAGQAFEALYGVDLSQEMLELHCWESDGNWLYHIGGGGTMRKMWSIRLTGDRTNWPPQMECLIDATTGEIVYMNYSLPPAELEAMIQTPVDGCYSLDDNRWNEDDPSCAQTLKVMSDAAQELLSGSMLTEGATVTDARTELAKLTEDESDFRELRFFFTCENGKTYLLARNPLANPFSLYDFDGFPLRGYVFYNDTYMQG